MFVRWCAALALFAAAHAGAQDLGVYADALASGFENRSTGGGVDFANLSPVHAGSASIALSGNASNAISIAHPAGSFSTAQYSGLRFWVHGGTSGGQQLRIVLAQPGAPGDTIVAQAELDAFIPGGIAAGQWKLVTVDFAAAPLYFSGAFYRVDLVSDAAAAQPALYVDDVALVANTAAETVFADGFEGDFDPSHGAFRFSSSTYAANETAASATITVQRVGGSSGAVSVHYATADGSAAAPGDYAATSGTLTWAAGDASDKTFTIAPHDDSLVEGDETVRIVLDSPGGGAAIGSPAGATLTLIDDDTACQLAIDRDVTVASMVSDTFRWCDAAGQPRAATLAHNDVIGPNNVRGGALREFRYEIPGGTRIVPVTSTGNGGQGGFGYVVSHSKLDGQNHVIPCSDGVANDGPRGDTIPGTWTRVFEGRHHAVFRFQQDYPRFGCTTAGTPTQTYQMPVTVDWVFSSGRDHPLWAITYDLSGIPANAVLADSRSPYGELNFDGTPTGGTMSTIAGVAWGERYKFTSTTDPVSYQSDWTWNELNSVPYVKLWTSAVDATMGTVQTQTMSQQDAGGYFGAGRWRTTSADGSACPGAGVIMPCSTNWPFQSINFSLGVPTGTTTVSRLAWGANFGFLGQTTYPVMGSSQMGIGGPVGNGNPTNNPYAFEAATASGWPRRSYSTFVVLGRHSVDPVGAQVAQIETVQRTTLTATIGSVATSGPAGVNRPDTVTFAPAGWNHVYAAWTLIAASNRVDANFAIGSGTLARPMLIVSNWTSGALPTSVKLNNAVLVQDVDYFPSVRAGSNELWITLDRDLAGATNRLEVFP